MADFSSTRPLWLSSASHRQLASLIADFGRFTDGRQWASLTALLAPVILLGNPNEPPGVTLSAEQFTGRWRTWLDELGITQHGLTTRHIAVFGTKATCFVDALITSCPNPETVLQWGGQFGFVFALQADAWQISQLEIVPLWITESPGSGAVLARLKHLVSPDGETDIHQRNTTK